MALTRPTSRPTSNPVHLFEVDLFHEKVFTPWVKKDYDHEEAVKKLLGADYHDCGPESLTPCDVMPIANRIAGLQKDATRPKISAYIGYHDNSSQEFSWGTSWASEYLGVVEDYVPKVGDAIRLNIPPIRYRRWLRSTGYKYDVMHGMRGTVVAIQRSKATVEVALRTRVVTIQVPASNKWLTPYMPEPDEQPIQARPVTVEPCRDPAAIEAIKAAAVKRHRPTAHLVHVLPWQEIYREYISRLPETWSRMKWWTRCNAIMHVEDIAWLTWLASVEQRWVSRYANQMIRELKRRPLRTHGALIT